MGLLNIILGTFLLKNTLHTCSIDNIPKISRDLPTDIEEADDLDYKSGYCEPVFENADENKEKLAEISAFLHKKKIFNSLLNKKISVLDKIKLIERDTEILDEKYGSNIMSGGLLDDWNFEFILIEI